MSKFKSGEEMYKYLRDGHDLYCESQSLYIFEYSEVGSLATYHLHPSTILELCAAPGYWSEHLGPGGNILETQQVALDFCRENYQLDWVDTGELKKES